MGDVLLEFIISGKIPGLDFELGYYTSIVIAGLSVLFIAWYIIHLFGIYRKRLLKLQNELQNSIDAITV
ncbi:hypothetical protein KC930_00075 [Candidatus Saccharibacteria bacterium]|nr:hypothetical protein [Candidatus Saccharibacteria bacterium]